MTVRACVALSPPVPEAVIGLVLGVILGVVIALIVAAVLKRPEPAKVQA